MSAKPHVLILGCNFAGLTTARYIREFARENSVMGFARLRVYCRLHSNLNFK